MGEFTSEVWPFGIGWEVDARLLPCPFCVSPAVLGFSGNDRSKTRSVTCKCTKCRFQRRDATFFHDHEWLRDVAIEAWNTRTSPTTDTEGA